MRPKMAQQFLPLRTAIGYLLILLPSGFPRVFPIELQSVSQRYPQRLQ